MDAIISRVKSFFHGDERSVTVKKNIVYSIIIKMISIVVAFLIVPVTIGYVSAELYGVWLTLSSIMTWIAFMDIGFTQGLKNRLTEAIAIEDWDRCKELVSTTYFMMLIIFIPVSIILILLVPLINWCELLNVNSIYSEEIGKVMVVVIGFACLQMIVNVIVSVVAAFQKVALSNSFSVIGNIFSLIFIIILTKTCPPSLIYLSVTFCSLPVIVTFLASIYFYHRGYKKVAPSVARVRTHLVKDLFDLGYKFFIINIQVIVLYQSTNVLISYVSSPLMVTSYNLAYRYLNLAMMLFTIITAPLWPAYTDAYTKGDYDWMIGTRKMMQKVFAASIMLSILLIIMSPIFYNIWVGDKAEVPLIMTLCVAFYVISYCWSNLNGTLIIGMLLHIPVSLVLSNSFGAYGVLISLTFITLIYAIVVNIQVNKILNKTAVGIWIE